MRPVGATEPCRVNVRVLAASNVPLRQAVAGGRFRPDLYYRLAVIAVALPLLRERLEDSPLLVEHFLRKFQPERLRTVFSPDALLCLGRHSWPGNVRELENVVQAALILAEGSVVSADALPLAVGLGEARPSWELAQALDAAGQAAVRHALQEAGGNKTRAAAILGVSRTTLYNRLRRMARVGRSASVPFLR